VLPNNRIEPLVFCSRVSVTFVISTGDLSTLEKKMACWGAYEYSVPGAAEDFTPEHESPEFAAKTDRRMCDHSGVRALKRLKCICRAHYLRAVRSEER